MKRYHTDPRGFTLTEILIAISIVVVLVAIAIPVASSARSKSRKAGCLSNLRQIGIGLESWLQDHNNTMPQLAAGRSNKNEDIAVLETTLTDYLSSPDVFHCPEDKTLYQKSGSSYLWNSTQSGRSKMQLAFFGTDEPSRIPLVIDKEAWHGDENGVNMLYADYSASGQFKFTTSP